MLDPGLTGRSDRPVPTADNGFLAGYRVRFDEAGPDGRVRTSAVLRYAQDVTWRHSEALGFGREWYAERGLGWVARSVDIRLARPILMGQTLRVSTAVAGHRRIWARRLADARSADGDLVGRVVTDWVLLDARGRLVRIPSDFGLHFTNPELTGEILRAPIGERPADAAAIRLAVRPQDLDPVGHVNNATYLDWVEEALLATRPDGEAVVQALPRVARLEYLASAGPGDEVVATAWSQGAAWFVTIARAGGAELLRATGAAPAPTDDPAAAIEGIPPGA